MKIYISIGRNLCIAAFLLLNCGDAVAQVGIGTSQPDDSSILDISSTDKGLLIPRVFLTGALSNSLDGVNPSPVGLTVFNTNPNVSDGNGIGYYYWNATRWDKVTTDASNNSWSKNGNTLLSTDFLGSLTINPLISRSTILPQAPLIRTDP